MHASLDAIVNGMLDAQAEGELHRLEQLRRLSLHAGPAFDDAVQARLASQQQMLALLAVEHAPDVTARVLARARAQRLAEQESSASAPLARVPMLDEAEHVRAGTDDRERALVQASRVQASRAQARPAREGQGGRAVRPVHHRRRWFSSTALAFLAGGLVTLALVSVQLAQSKTGDRGPAMAAGESQPSPLRQPTPRIALTLDELTSRAFFSPDELPMIDEPASTGVLRLGNSVASDVGELPGSMASNATTLDRLSLDGFGVDAASERRLQAEGVQAQAGLRMQDASPTALARSAPPAFASKAGPHVPLTPEPRAEALRLLSWGMTPWQFSKPAQ
jgi:hypothetical protein